MVGRPVPFPNEGTYTRPTPLGSQGARLTAGRPAQRTAASAPRQAPLAGRPCREHATNREPPRARRAQPLEPILVPKLRIHFADFPYLHYSID